MKYLESKVAVVEKSHIPRSSELPAVLIQDFLDKLELRVKHLDVVVPGVFAVHGRHHEVSVLQEAKSNLSTKFPHVNGSYLPPANSCREVNSRR